MIIKQLPWSLLNVNAIGNTECLIFEIAKENIEDDTAEDIIEKNRPVKNSIRMQYITFVTCIDDKRPEFKENKANYDKYFPLIVNKQDETDGYFWAVLELKIIKEGSMVVEPSCFATPILQNPSTEETKCTNCNKDMTGEYCSSCGTQRKNIEPSQDTQKEAAALALRKKKQFFINLTTKN